MENREIALKKCPFCGGAVVTETTVCDFAIRCWSCAYSIFRDNRFKKGLIKMWNTRALDEKDARVKVLVEAAKKHLSHDYTCSIAWSDECDCASRGLFAALKPF